VTKIGKEKVGEKEEIRSREGEEKDTKNRRKRITEG
jgi:hypothetical protein